MVPFLLECGHQAIVVGLTLEILLSTLKLDHPLFLRSLIQEAQLIIKLDRKDLRVSIGAWRQNDPPVRSRCFRCVNTKAWIQHENVVVELLQLYLEVSRL